jgi:predicted TPR repeat methyltransferase
MAPPHDGTEDWLGGFPGRLRPALRACAENSTPTNIAVLKLLMAATSPEEAEHVLALACMAVACREAARRLRAAQLLLYDNPQAYQTVKAVLRDIEHGGASQNPEQPVAHWAAAFDRMALVSAEGSVALYALGNPDLLRAATAEVVACLRDHALLGRDRRVVEIGCGIGRFVEALAPEVRRIIGLDISKVMIKQAKARCARFTNVALAVSSGRDLSAVPDDSVDLVLASDVFPYLIQAEDSLAERHLSESRRVLTSRGALVILNFSYRGHPEQDRIDLERLGPDHGFCLESANFDALKLWDAPLFLLRRIA